MPIGIECYDTNGRLVFNSADRLGRIVGSQPTNQIAAGNIYVPAWEAGDVIPWVISVPFNSLFTLPFAIQPSVYIHDNRRYVVWQYMTTSTGNLAQAMMIWGVR